MKLSDLAPPASRPQRRSARRDRDAYFTPRKAIDSLLVREPGIGGESLLDPCCGDGRMAAQLAPLFRSVGLNDIEIGAVEPSTTRQMRSAFAFLTAHDASRVPGMLWQTVSWVITNPPWSLASEIAQAAIKYSTCGVALLLRLSFLEATQKRSWLCSCPPKAILVLPRISFDGTGQTDSVPPAWFLWGDAVRNPGIHIVGKTHPLQMALGLPAHEDAL